MPNWTPSNPHDSDYARYVRTRELFALQKTPADRANPDELLFQVMHQSAELWMQEILSCLSRAQSAMPDDGLTAVRMFVRARLVLDHLAASLPILETMPPARYHEVRVTLGRGSGQDSPGFNSILAAPAGLWGSFHPMLKKTGVSLIELHRAPQKHPLLFEVVQSMMAFDESFQKWRYGHFQLVRREIGDQVRSLKGVPAAKLVHGTTESLFPELWDVINELTRETSAEY